jgi:hypothetical protein
MTTAPACERWRQAVFEASDPARAVVVDGRLAPHRETCAACRRWLDVYLQGLNDAVTIAGVGGAAASRTARAACTRARELMAAGFDGSDGRLDSTEHALVDGHLTGCDACREVEAAMSAAAEWLPTMAEVDPGPFFTAQVLAATSRRPARTRFADAWRAAWAAMIARPRFPIEAAYVATVVLVLVAGNPTAAFERTTARIEPARVHLAVGLETLNRTVTGRLGRLTEGAERRRMTSDAGEFSERARDLWGRVVDAVADSLSGLLQALESFARRIWQWGLDIAAVWAAAEPSDVPTRSFQ